MLDQARSAPGKSDPRLSATFALRWSRLIEHDITRGTVFFSPRISRMVLFSVQGSSRHRNCCQTWPAQAFPKKETSPGVRGQLMRSNQYRSSPAFRHDHCKHINKSKHLFRGQMIRSNSRTFSTTSIYMLSVTDFKPKGTISEVSVHAGAKFGHTRWWSIAKCRQRSHRNCTGGFRSWPPTMHLQILNHAGDLLITMVKETVILYKKEFRKMKKKWNLFDSLVDLKVMKRYWRRDCLWLCQACKRGFIYVKKFSPGSTQLPTSQHLLSPS